MAKKILYIITKATSGGAQRYVHDLVRSLPRGSFEPVIAHGIPGSLSEDLAHEGFRTIRIPSLGRDIVFFDDASSFFEMISYIRKEKPDVVHLNSSKAAALGALAARIARVPTIVFTVHGWPFKERRSFLSRGAIYIASWLTALLCHKVIVVSKQDEELGLAMWKVARKIHYIPIGIEPPTLLPKDDALAAIWMKTSSDKIPRNSIKVVTIAELTANKGIRYAIEAFAQLQRLTKDNYVYIIISDGEQRRMLEDFTKKLDLTDKVFFLGFMSNASQYLNAFDIFLLPSIKEGMPYALLEALDSGIPSIATDAVNLEVKHHFENLRVIPAGNVAAIVQALQDVKESPRTSDYRLGRFPLVTMIDDTIALY